MAYLNLTNFTGAGGTIMPSVLVNRLQTERPGWIDARLEKRSRFIDAKLQKRYATPFNETSPPLVVVDWLIAIVTLEAYGALGVNPTSEMDQQLIVAPYLAAMKQIDEAADSETGLFELPARQDVPTSIGIVNGGPFGHSEQSPYVGFDDQRAQAQEEDRSRVG